jgi:hypothetical protein
MQPFLCAKTKNSGNSKKLASHLFEEAPASAKDAPQIDIAAIVANRISIQNLKNEIPNDMQSEKNGEGCGAQGHFIWLSVGRIPKRNSVS